MNRSEPSLLFLHALPLDGSMWADYMDLLPDSSFAPTLYGLGDSIEGWAHEVLRQSTKDRLIVVGCSVGGSCAIEVALAAPDRVEAIVLIGTKAAHNQNPDFRDSAHDLLETEGIGVAWDTYWAPLFSQSTSSLIVEKAKNIALSMSRSDIANGISVFHSRPSRDKFASRFRMPVIVVTGEDDTAPGVQASADLSTSMRLEAFGPSARPDTTFHLRNQKS